MYVRKINVPFKFEGKEIPSSISGRVVFKENMIFLKTGKLFKQKDDI